MVRCNMTFPYADRASLVADLERYAAVWPMETEVVAQFLALAADPADPYVRERLDGHFTGSAWLVNAAGTHLLMTHHRKLDRWLQLGGHADGDRDLAAVALKEAEEESGLAALVVEGGIFDIDRHWIPERKDVPGTGITTCAMWCAPPAAKPSWSATNRTRSPGARSRRCWTTRPPIRRSAAWP